MFKRAKSGTEYVVIDTETTGLHMDARVIELAMVVVSADGKIKDNFSTFLRGTELSVTTLRHVCMGSKPIR